MCKECFAAFFVTTVYLFVMSQRELKPHCRTVKLHLSEEAVNVELNILLASVFVFFLV